MSTEHTKLVEIGGFCTEMLEGMGVIRKWWETGDFVVSGWICWKGLGSAISEVVRRLGELDKTE